MMAVAASAKDGGEPGFAFDISKCQVAERFRNHPLFSEKPICGVNFGFLAKRGYFAQPHVKAMPRQMKESGVTWVMLNTHFCQESFASRKIFLDPVYSSGEEELAEIVRILQAEGLHIILKPCLTLLDSAWMGAVQFPGPAHQIEGVDTCSRYWPDWFDSLRQMLRYFGEFAERHHIDAMLVGAEYSGSLQQTDEWLKTIADVRKVYSGPLSYEFMRNYEPDGTDGELFWEFTHKIAFIDALDFLSISWYPRARPFTTWGNIQNCPHTTLEEMVAYLRPATNVFERTVAMYGRKPVVFTEIGQRSSHGCVSLPYDAGAPGAYDAAEQADYMEAIFRTFSTRPEWKGLFWWKWDETQKRPHYDPDPKKDRGFSIYGKPAAEVLKKWSGQAQ